MTSVKRGKNTPSRDRVDGISLTMDPDVIQNQAKSDAMIERALHAKIVGYYVLLGILVGLTLVSCICLACGHENPIWAMIITYTLGVMNGRGASKAGKYAKAIYDSKGREQLKEQSVRTPYTPSEDFTDGVMPKTR